jgi:hypothetical protein
VIKKKTTYFKHFTIVQHFFAYRKESGTFLNENRNEST